MQAIPVHDNENQTEYTLLTFIEKAIQIHGEKYDYSQIAQKFNQNDHQAQ